MVEDLYEMFRTRLGAGESVLHPHRWLTMRSLEMMWILHLSLRRFGERPRSTGSRKPTEVTQLLFRIAGRDVYDIKELYGLVRRRPRESRAGVYWADPQIAAWYRDHKVDGAEVECAVKDWLKELDPTLRLEVFTPAGFVDGVTDKHLIEVKRLARWKEGLGQLCAYSVYLPGLQPLLYLFGSPAAPPRLSLIREVCVKYNVAVEYKHTTTSSIAAASRQPSFDFSESE